MRDATDAELIDAAVAIRARAHAPYSGFAVGAAIRDEAGRIHVGCNVENASYPCGVCAEASAISAMVAGRGREIRTIAVAGPAGRLTTPCGACRQRIREFATAETTVVVVDPAGRAESYALDALLPVSFGPESL
ncbi:MAG: cytidine deaminase [Thermohalobaculum sp.]|nr:cytidine deaminase [Thermohalobaculum sp.]